jgi:hypothetical protein
MLPMSVALRSKLAHFKGKPVYNKATAVQEVEYEKDPSETKVSQKADIFETIVTCTSNLVGGGGTIYNIQYIIHSDSANTLKC